MIAMGKRSGCEVGARALARVNRGRNWKDGMDSAGKAEEIWRRVTGITVEMEGKMDERERKCAARRLVKWVEAHLNRVGSRGSGVESPRKLAIQSGDDPCSSPTPHPALPAVVSALSPDWGEGKLRRKLGLVREVMVGIWSGCVGGWGYPKFGSRG